MAQEREKFTAEQRVQGERRSCENKKRKEKKPERKKGKRFLSGVRDCGSEFQQNVERVDVVLLSAATVQSRANEAKKREQARRQERTEGTT